ncbi:uncharacterized protein LOC129412152 [Boleophthalmus pectinirostris]|uniref:uncharacterized protein LOC129412152 n=1 Tax=Boleophthalmus pectinirostris TaxID=150288 RepID=UPI002431AE08|nr:uncharacterized protein LOC129412152 [Boleophthalmus pectinirostris]
MQAGLGPRTAHLDESITHEELCDALKALYPKLRTLSGGWLLYKSTGGWGSRKLALVSPDDAGYTGRLLKSAAQGGKKLFIVPLQEDLDTSPLELTDEAFKGMAKVMCQKCGVDVPLQLLKDHVNSCSVIEIDGEQPVEDTSHLVGEKSVSCPVCLKMFPTDWIQEHASTCGESPVTPAVTSATVTSAKVTYEEDHAAIAGTSTSSATVTGDWLSLSDPREAISQYAKHFLQNHAMDSPLILSMDIRKSLTEQDMALISFYKQKNVEWACPLKCRLEGKT